MGKIEVYESRDDFFKYSDFSDIIINDELLSLHDEVYSNAMYKDVLHKFPQNCYGSFDEKSIQLWEDLGIKLHKVYAFNDRLDRLITLPNGIDMCNVDLINPSEIFLKIMIPYITISPVGCVNFILGKTDDIGKIVIFDNIMVHSFDSNITSCFYNHEIAHTQISSMIGSCTNRLDNEVIPALMEQITAYNLDPSLETLWQMRNYDMWVISDCIHTANMSKNDYDEMKIPFTYVRSYLQSFNMANIYLEGNQQLRDEMHQYINSIFKGNRSVEDMLNHYDSSYENVPKKLELIRNIY